ncbi:hypothetical protein ACQ4PT_002601 [Festuca glaucescens]
MTHYLNAVSKDHFIELEKAFELFSEGGSYFGPVWDHYLGYWKQSIVEPDRVLFLKYEEMMADPVKHVKTLAEFLWSPVHRRRGGRRSRGSRSWTCLAFRSSRTCRSTPRGHPIWLVGCPWRSRPISGMGRWAIGPTT